jgi:hypothetical protein
MDFFDELAEQADAEAELMFVPPKTLRNTKALTDEDPMPFGKYAKVGCKIKDVPAQYLLWWYSQEPKNYPELFAYIVKNKTTLEEEAREYGGDYDQRRERTIDDYDYDRHDDWGDRD